MSSATNKTMNNMRLLKIILQFKKIELYTCFEISPRFIHGSHCILRKLNIMYWQILKKPNVIVIAISLEGAASYCYKRKNKTV